ncbi:restriction endonuclease subunit S [Veillonella sp.]|uniref:restriction endonuclease subunit S n=1 Tax=Veillonella sp. TaxID=1926307 RepID=UPI0025CEF89E|nr:restriction endonuclease subunit S [Veillonella sp.]
MMSKEKRRVPKLRFPGFTEDWEQRKLGNIVDFLDGQRKPLKESERTKGKYPYYGASGIIDYINDYLFDENLVLLSEDGANIIDRNYPVCFIATGKYWVNNHAHVLKVKTGVIDKFICESLERLDYTKFNTGTAQPKLNQDICQKIVITIPNEDEQKCISEFLDKINNIITLHQRKLDNLKLKKKALLQKLFPKNGERYPELRFPGFTDAWEQRKLGSIGSTYTGLSGKTKEDFGHGEAKYITYLNVFQNTISNITMTDKVEIDPTQNEVKYGDVLFTTSSETPEEVGMSSVWLGDTPNIYLNSFCFGFRPNQKIDSYFLGYSLRAPYMRDKIKILAQGISRYNISKNKVMELEISLPNNEEQKLLGTFLQRIDLIITLHQRKLDHLQLQKKALLQQMSV